MLAVTGFPFAFGIAASLLAMLAAPSTPGCGESAERVLVAGADGLAARVGGLHLGELGDAIPAARQRSSGTTLP